MSFDHKAFEFNWPAFSHEILPWLSDVLAADDREKLSTFIDTNVSACSSPYDGSPLPCEKLGSEKNWGQMKDSLNLHLTRMALT